MAMQEDVKTRKSFTADEIRRAKSYVHSSNLDSVGVFAKRVGGKV